MHINNKEFYKEIVISKGLGELTPRASKMLTVLATEALRKKTYEIPDDKLDCYQTGLLHLFQKWHGFDEERFSNAFAYFTEIFKRGMGNGWNELKKKKGDPTNSIKIISVESSNEGNGLHSI